MLFVKGTNICGDVSIHQLDKQRITLEKIREKREKLNSQVKRTRKNQCVYFISRPKDMLFSLNCATIISVS